MTVAPKTLVFSVSVALRSAVHERQRLRSQLLSSASNSNDSGSEDTCLLSASSSEVSCFQMSEVPSCFDRFRMPVPPRQLFSIVFECQWLRDSSFRLFSSASGSEDSSFRVFSSASGSEDNCFRRFSSASGSDDSRFRVFSSASRSEDSCFRLFSSAVAPM